METIKTSYLSQEDVDALPSGTLVSITWTGGNGPHVYELVNVDGKAYTIVPRQTGLQVPLRAGAARDRVDFVGSERFHTRVSLALDTVLE